MSTNGNGDPSVGEQEISNMTNNGIGNFALSQQEISTLDRFKLALNDVGVQGRLLEKLGYKFYHDLPVMLLTQYVNDVKDTDSAEMHTAGVSLQSLVYLVHEAGIFPEDFIPQPLLVKKCINGFWTGLSQSG